MPSVTRSSPKPKPVPVPQPALLQQPTVPEYNAPRGLLKLPYRFLNRKDGHLRAGPELVSFAQARQRNQDLETLKRIGLTALGTGAISLISTTAGGLFLTLFPLASQIPSLLVNSRKFKPPHVGGLGSLYYFCNGLRDSAMHVNDTVHRDANLFNALASAVLFNTEKVTLVEVVNQICMVYDKSQVTADLMRHLVNSGMPTALLVECAGSMHRWTRPGMIQRMSCILAEDCHLKPTDMDIVLKDRMCIDKSVLDQLTPVQKQRIFQSYMRYFRNTNRLIQHYEAIGMQPDENQGKQLQRDYAREILQTKNVWLSHAMLPYLFNQWATKGITKQFAEFKKKK